VVFMKKLFFLILLIFLIHSISADESIDKQLNIKPVVKLNGVNISGIIFLNSGIASAITGIVLFVYDDGKYTARIGSASDHYMAGFARARTADANYSMFASGLALIFSGAVLITASIPMMLYKKQNISLKLSAGDNFGVALSYCF
jgi:hypothetical protein